MSYHRLTPRPLNATLSALLKRGAHLGVGVGAFAPVLALANPTGGQVVAGQATIATPSKNGMVIDQSSQSAVINWQQFSIGKGQYVQFIQPSSSSVVLNRVVGGTPSLILGSLKANGQVFLVNANGVFFGKTAVLDVQGILASTLNIDNSSFMSGNYLFDQPGAAGATVVNQGHIRAHNGGYVVLAGDYSENSGIITAQSGHIILASGTKATLSLNGNNLVNFAVNQATLANYAGVENSGSLIADGGTVIMTADVANALKATVVNNTGLVEAHAMDAQGGHIYLTATGGNIQNSGTLDANAAHAGQAGGDIVLKGDARTLLTNTSNITATGDGANGGTLELSGSTISVRGSAKLGNGGKMLLDPGQVIIGSKSSSSNYGNSSLSSNIGHIGVKFIDSTLKAGTSIIIKAYDSITHSSKATAITATSNPLGNLTLNVRNGGSIKLAGLNIDIAGSLKASVSPGGGGSHDAAMSFGRITAKDIVINAGNGDVTLAAAAVVGGVLKPSLKSTTGDITVTGGNIAALSGGSLNVQAAGSLFMIGTVSNAGDVTMTASQDIYAHRIVSGKDLTLSAKQYKSNVSDLEYSAAGNLTIKGAIGSASSAFVGSVTLTAGKTISLDHSVYNRGTSFFGANLTITAGHLVYTGKGTFTLSAGYGNLILDASIGSAAKPVHAVNLVDNGYGLFIERSIYASDGITVAESGIHALFLSPSDVVPVPGEGVVVGNSDGKAITLSAKGAISLRGNAVRIGGKGTIDITADDGNSATHADTLTINSTVSSTSGFGVFIGGSFAGANNHGSVANLSVDHSVTLNAGQDVDISGYIVKLGGNAAFASVHGSGVTATAKDDITVTAGNDINLSATKSVTLHADGAIARAQSDTKAAATATAEDDITLNAGRDFNVTAASAADLSAGYGAIVAVTTAAKQKVTATGSADLDITAGRNIKLTAGRISINAGGNVGKSASIHASQSSARAAATAKGNLNLIAGGDFTAAASGDLSISGGSKTAYKATAKAKHGATASLTAEANLAISGDHVKFSAGGSDMSIAGGEDAAEGAVAQASDKAVAKIVASGTVSLSAKSALTATLTGTGTGGTLSIHVDGGAANSASAKASHQGTATISADDSLKISVSAGTLTITTGTRTSNSSKSSQELKLQVYSSYAAHSAFASGNGGVAAVTGKGNLSLSATGAVKIAASGGLLSIYTSTENAKDAGASAFGAGAKASITAGDAVTISGGTIALKAGAAGLYVFAGSSHLEGAFAVADSSGKAAVTALSSVTLTAGGAFTASAGGSLWINGGGKDGLSASAKANHGGTAILSDDDTATVKAASIALTAAGTLEIFGGVKDVGYGAVVKASNAAVAAISAKSGVDLVASTGKFSATTVKSLHIFAGAGGSSTSDAGNAALASVHGVHHGQASLLVDTSVNIKGSSVALAASANLNVIGESYNLARGASVFASDFGKATLTADGMVNVAAVKAFSAKLNGAGSHHHLEIDGGSSAAYGVRASAQHHGVATLAASDGINITVTGAGGTITLTTGNQTSGYLSMGGYNNNGYSAFAFASHGATAAVNDKSGVTLKAPGNVSIKTGTGGGLSIYGGYEYTGYNASASASGHSANAAVNVSDTINISGANVSLSAGKRMEIYAGFEYNGAHSSSHLSPGIHGGALADGTAKAKVSIDVGLNITATGDLTAKASGMSIYGGDEHNGQSASAHADHGAAAAYTVNDAVSITAGGNVTLTATVAGLSIYGGYEYNGSDDVIKADNLGAAAFGVTNDVVIAAKGTFTASAAKGLEIYGNNYYEAANASMDASHGGKAAMAGDGSVRITASSIKLTAGANHNLSIYGGTSSNGDYADMTASDSGAATLSAKAGVTLTATTGDFTATAGGALKIYGGSEVAESDSLTAKHHSQATLTADTSVNISGDHVNLTAGGSSLKLSGGSHAAYNDDLHASDGAAANLAAKSSLNITAKSGFTADLNGSAAHGNFYVVGGDEAGYSGSAYAYSNSKANISGDATVNIKATAGTLTFKVVGTHTSGGYVKVLGGSEDAYTAFASASDLGVATVTGKGGVNLTAAGNISITDAKDELLVYAGSAAAELAQGQGAGAGAKTLITGDASITIKATGGSVTLGAGSYVALRGGNYAAYSATASANSGAVAKTTGTSKLTITAGTTLSAKGGSDLSIYGDASEAREAHATAIGAKTTASVTGQDNVSLSAQGTVTLAAGSASTDTLKIYSKSLTAANTTFKGSSGGVATLDAESRVSIKAGGALTAAAGGAMDFNAGDDAASDAYLTGKDGTAKLTTDVSVSVSAGGAMTLTLKGGNLTVQGGSQGGRHAALTGSDSGGKATLGDTQTVSLTAGGALTENGADDVNLLAGVFAATGTDALVTLVAPGTAAATVNSGLTLKGTSVTLHQTGALTKTPQLGLNAGGLTEIGTITVSGTPVHLSLSPLTLPPVDDWSRATLDVAPSTGAVSFGAPRTLGAMPGASFSLPSASVGILPVVSGLGISSQSLPLGCLADHGLVVHLVTVAAGACGSPSSALSPGDRGGQGTLYLPLTDRPGLLGSSCPSALLVQAAGDFQAPSGR